MSRRSLSDIIEAQEAMLEKLLAMQAQTLEALTEKSARTASETFKVARSGTGDHSTAIAVEVVPQDGETLADARNRAMVEYEAAAARYPMANGLTHAAPLSSEAPTLAEQLVASAADEVASKRAKRGKDGAK